MLDNKFVLLLITLIWMSGLFAIVLTVAYMVQDRRQRWQYDGYTWSIPRILSPLFASLAIFCLGLALHAYAAQTPVSLWITIVWGLLTISFVARMIGALFSGVQYGWNTRLNARLHVMEPAGYGEQGGRIPVWGGLVVALLLVNLILLGRWGSIQIRAGAFAQQPSDDDQAENITAPPQVVAQAPISNTLPVVVVEVTATATVEPAKEAPPAMFIPQLAAQETVTPATSLLTVTIPISTPGTEFQAPQASITVQNAKGANVRQGPSLNAQIMTVLNDATVMPVEGRTADSQWFLIRLPDGQLGWISVIVAVPNEAVGNSPIIAAN